MARRYDNKSSGKHSAELKALYAAEAKKLNAQPGGADLPPKEFMRLALEPGRQRLAEIRRENLVKAREVLKRKREAAAKQLKQEADKRFEAKSQLSKRKQ